MSELQGLLGSCFVSYWCKVVGSWYVYKCIYNLNSMINLCLVNQNLHSICSTGHAACFHVTVRDVSGSSALKHLKLMEVVFGVGAPDCQKIP